MKGGFRSLGGYNYRVWACGAFVSNIGTWMQRTAQDWLVLTVLTRHNAAAVGVVTALQFGPQILCLPWTGFAADHFDRRRLVMCTQAAMGALALGLGLLTVTGLVQLWQVYGFAFLLGCVSAFDAPARQSFVSDLVDEVDLSSAIGLNSASFHAARMVGPAAAGLLIGATGTGSVFIINAASFLAVLIALTLLRRDALHNRARVARGAGGLMEGFRYVWARPDLIAVLLMLFLFGTFGLNFGIYISTMAVSVFHADASRYGVLASCMALGSVSGALFAASRERPGMRLLVAAAFIFGVGCALAAMSPRAWVFGLVLIGVGVAAQTLLTSGNSLVQLTTDPAMRGRVMAIVMAIALGGTPIGSPLVGWVVNAFGARWGMAVGAAGGVAAGVVGLVALGKKVFFFENKNQKTFATLDQAVAANELK